MDNYKFFIKPKRVLESNSFSFKLSTCFEITDVRYSESCTFFKIESKARDVLFNPEPLKEAIGMKKAASGYFYINGHWDFIGIEGVDLTAIRIIP